MKNMVAAIGLVVLASLLPCLPAFPAGRPENPRRAVALYADRGVWPECLSATRQLLSKLGIRFRDVDRKAILSGRLGSQGTLLMPGGDMYVYGQYLSADGKAGIRKFVENGGSYLGICGGAYYCARTILWSGWANQPRRTQRWDGLGIFPGNAEGPLEEFAPGYESMAPLRIAKDSLPQVTGSMPAAVSMRYSHGPGFLPGDGSAVEVVGTSSQGGRLIVAFPFGRGKVFLLSTHPEFTMTDESSALFRAGYEWLSGE